MACVKFNRTKYNRTKFNTSQLNQVLIAEIELSGSSDIYSKISRVTFLINHEYRKFNRNKFNRSNANKSLPKAFISGQGSILSTARKTTNIMANVYGSELLTAMGYRVVLGNSNVAGKGDIEVIGHIVRLIEATLTGEGDILADVFIIYMPSSYVSLPTTKVVLIIW